MCRPPGNELWSPAGVLSQRELTIGLEVSARGGQARFNVQDAGGFRGRRKCNLFALELAHRAGFRVPLVARARGLGFPGADRIARDAGRGAVARWAAVADAWAPEEVARARAKGACFLLVASAPGRRPGHVVVVDRLLDVQQDPRGALTRIRYVGWDAARAGARHAEGVLSLRACGGRFDEMHLLALQAGGGPELAANVRPGPSRLDRRPA